MTLRKFKVKILRKCQYSPINRLNFLPKTRRPSSEGNNDDILLILLLISLQFSLINTQTLFVYNDILPRTYSSTQLYTLKSFKKPIFENHLQTDNTKYT